MVLGIKKYKPPFKLMGKSLDGEWEELEEYEDKKSLSDVKDTIEEYRDQGYYAFRLQDSKGRVVWYKSYKRDKRTGMSVDDILEMAKKYRALKEALSELGGEKVDPYEVLASQVSMFTTIRKFCEQFPEICGRGFSGEGLKGGLEIVKWIVDMLGGGSLERAENVLESMLGFRREEKVSSEFIKGSITEEGARKINEIASRAVDEALKTVKSECEVVGTCEGGEGGEGS
jgi:hypothetical protein